MDSEQGTYPPGVTPPQRRSRFRPVPVLAGVVASVLVLTLGSWFVWHALVSTGQPGGTARLGSLDPSAGSSGGAAGTPVATPTAAPQSSAPSASTTCDAWGCAQQQRFAAATALLQRKPGYLGIMVRDRQTGAVWTSGAYNRRIWAGSTPKLALATSLLERARTGAITLDATARSQIAAMLATSDDNAADALWDRYAGVSQMSRFQQTYGMSTAGFVPGFPQRWGFIKLTAVDLSNLMRYILERLNPTDRAYLLNAMRTVGAIQHWGVWAAGPAMQPGVKDGWSVETDDNAKHWITDTVGFAGPGERYIVSAMYQLLPGSGTVSAGTHAVSDLIATVFGAPVPAPITVPDPSTGY